MEKVEVTYECLELIYNVTKELRMHGCTYSDLELLDKIRDRTKYYLKKSKSQIDNIVSLHGG